MEKLDIFSEDFNFNEFQKEAIGKLKTGQSLTGKDGILTPLIKQLIEASLEGELDAHLEVCCQATGENFFSIFKPFSLPVAS